MNPGFASKLLRSGSIASEYLDIMNIARPRGKSYIWLGLRRLAFSSRGKLSSASPAKIIVSGLTRDAKKLALAKELGADHVIDVEQEDLRKRVQELKKHDRVVTTGGIFGTLVNIDEATVTLEVGKDMRMKMKRSSIFDLEDGDKIEAELAASKGKKPVPAKAKA